MTGGALGEAWSALSEIQRRAAEWNDGPLLVLAGPGSGKTRVLTCRIARLLQETPDQKFAILAVTFTNKAADEMRQRVKLFAPEAEQRVFLGTFHSFCADLLRQHGVHIGIQPDFQIYSMDSDLKAVLDKAVSEARKESALISDLDANTLPVIQRLKGDLVRPEECGARFTDPEFLERIGLVYKHYEAQLRRLNALDFNSLILEAHTLLSRFPAMAKHVRRIYRFICVDEFQDTNPAQYALLKTIAGDEFRNIFVVADDDQIIYQWNGASHERLGQFVKDFAPEMLQLPVNYRCPPAVVDLANKLIQRNFRRTADKAPLVAAKVEDTTDRVRVLGPFGDSEDEAAGVAKDIASNHQGHLDSVAVLARNRRLLEGVAEKLRAKDLPHRIAQRKDAFESTPLVWLDAALLLASSSADARHLEPLSGAFRQVSGIEVPASLAIDEAATRRIGLLQAWTGLARQRANGNPACTLLDSVERYLVTARDVSGFAGEIFGWFDSLSVEKRTEADPGAEHFVLYEEEKAVWRELAREIREACGSGISLDAFLQELQLRSKETPPKPGEVLLSTIHAAKGKEFAHVYLVGMVEEELPSFQSCKAGDDSLEMEEERRNCFVAITRTGEMLTLSYAQHYRGWPKKPSRFLREMGVTPGRAMRGTRADRSPSAGDGSRGVSQKELTVREDEAGYGSDCKKE